MYAAPSQVAVDVPTGPGRHPSEGQELLSWMESKSQPGDDDLPVRVRTALLDAWHALGQDRCGWDVDKVAASRPERRLVDILQKEASRF